MCSKLSKMDHKNLVTGYTFSKTVTGSKLVYQLTGLPLNKPNQDACPARNSFSATCTTATHCCTASVMDYFATHSQSRMLQHIWCSLV